MAITENKMINYFAMLTHSEVLSNKECNTSRFSESFVPLYTSNIIEAWVKIIQKS